LSDCGRRLIGNLSKGFRQRLGIAQAIIHTPSVVILDEPTVGLDPLQVHQIRHLIRELAQHHSVLLSTHILPEVQAVCNRVQIINAGRTVFNQSLATLTDQSPNNVWQVAFATPPTLTVLNELPTVKTVEALHDGRLRIVGNGTETAGQLVATAVEKNWGLRELSPEKMTLEQIFMDLVYRDEEARS
jgi:ABC-2 type transport system ATP-binding protein